MSNRTPERLNARIHARQNVSKNARLNVIINFRQKARYNIRIHVRQNAGNTTKQNVRYMLDKRSDRMSEHKMSDTVECQEECPNKCQIGFQNICQIECQKGCQIECQNICQIECQLVGVTRRKQFDLVDRGESITTGESNKCTPQPTAVWNFE